MTSFKSSSLASKQTRRTWACYKDPWVQYGGWQEALRECSEPHVSLDLSRLSLNPRFYLHLRRHPGSHLLPQGNSSSACHWPTKMRKSREFNPNRAVGPFTDPAETWSRPWRQEGGGKEDLNPQMKKIRAKRLSAWKLISDRNHGDGMKGNAGFPLLASIPFATPPKVWSDPQILLPLGGSIIPSDGGDQTSSHPSPQLQALCRGSFS